MLGKSEAPGKSTREKCLARALALVLIMLGLTRNQAQKGAVGSGVRALASHARGQWFKSTTAHHHPRITALPPKFKK